MTKRLGNIWNEFVSYDNLYYAYKKARVGKGHRQSVLRFERDVKGNLLKLQESLLDGTWHSSKYRFFEIKEYGKKRLIASLPFYPDRIVHWAIMNVTHKRFEKHFIRQTFACIPNRGTHDALRYTKNYVQKDNAKYCLKLDESQYFPSINKHRLMEKIEHIIKDKRILDIFEKIIYEYPKDGIPIGNYTSQFFANLYLSELDHELKEKQHCRYYLRYMDDIVVIGWNKKWLHKIFGYIADYGLNNGLTIKHTWQIFPLQARALDFVGYVCHSKYTTLRKTTAQRMKRKTRHIPLKGIDLHQKGCIASYHGILIHCNGYNLHRTYLGMWIAWNISNISERKGKQKSRYSEGRK